MQAVFCPPPVNSGATASVARPGSSDGQGGTSRLGLWLVEQVLVLGVRDLNWFYFDTAVPLIAFDHVVEFVREVTVFKQSDGSVQLRIRKREDGQADVSFGIVDPDSPNAAFVAPFVQALQAVEQLVFVSQGRGFGVSSRMHGCSLDLVRKFQRRFRRRLMVAPM